MFDGERRGIWKARYHVKHQIKTFVSNCQCKFNMATDSTDTHG
jgi:hypothetical protein